MASEAGEASEACEEYARIVRETLEETFATLRQLALELVVGIGIGAALSFFTFGAAGAVAAGALAVRIAAVAARIGQLIIKVSSFAAKAASRITAARTRLNAIVQALSPRNQMFVRVGNQVVADTSASMFAEGVVRGDEANYFSAFAGGVVGAGTTAGILEVFGRRAGQLLPNLLAGGVGGFTGSAASGGVEGNITAQSLFLGTLFGTAGGTFGAGGSRTPSGAPPAVSGSGGGSSPAGGSGATPGSGSKPPLGEGPIGPSGAGDSAPTPVDVDPVRPPVDVDPFTPEVDVHPVTPHAGDSTPPPVDVDPFTPEVDVHPVTPHAGDSTPPPVDVDPTSPSSTAPVGTSPASPHVPTGPDAPTSPDGPATNEPAGTGPDAGSDAPPTDGGSDAPPADADGPSPDAPVRSDDPDAPRNDPRPPGHLPETGEPNTYGYDANGDRLPYANHRPGWGPDHPVDTVWNRDNAAQVDGINNGSYLDDPPPRTPAPNELFLKNETNEWELVTWESGQPRTQRWDMGHNFDQKYSQRRDFYLNGGESTAEFLRWFRNPDNYSVQHWWVNQSHVAE